MAIHPIQSANAQAQAQGAAALPKPPQAAQNAAPQDQVTISESAKQALANTTKPESGR
jgi:hypothetical protein